MEVNLGKSPKGYECSISLLSKYTGRSGTSRLGQEVEESLVGTGGFWEDPRPRNLSWVERVRFQEELRREGYLSPDIEA